MANLSHYGSDNLMEVHNHDNVNHNLINQAVQEAVQNSNSPAQQDALILYVIEQLKTQVVNCTKINLDNKEHLKENESLMQTVTLLKNDFQKEESRNIDREIALEKQIKELNNIVFKRNQSAQTVHMLTKPQFFYDHTTIQALGFQNPFYLKKAQQLEPKLFDDLMMSEKKVNTKPVDYAVLNQLSQEFKTRFLLQTKLSVEQAFWSQNSVNSPEPTPSTRPTQVEVPKELPKVSMVNTSLEKLKHYLASFDVVVKERTIAIAITEGVNLSTSASGSQPSGNTKKDKIQQTPSSSKKNKIEAHPRNVRSCLRNKNCVVKTKNTAYVQNSKSNVNFDLQYVTCNGCLFSDNHDSCVLEFINNVNTRVKSKSVKKPTGKVFTNIEYIWRPTGRTFTIVRNVCPLTRITTTAKVPLRKPISLESNPPKPVVTLVYSRKPKESRNNVSVSKSKINKSLSANKKEPNKSWDP
nr:hypothetical protein [Tanacetum cinerariifolium]